MTRVAVMLLAAALLAACASAPPAGTRIAVHVERMAQPFELALPRHSAALSALRAGAPAAAEAPIWIVRCALGADHGWTGLAEAPQGVTPQAGSVWWLTVDDAGDDSRLGSGRLHAPRTPALAGAAPAYGANLKRLPAPAADRYERVFSDYWIRCRQPLP